MKKAIVTLTIGGDIQTQAQYSHPSFRYYAKKVQADFIIFDIRKFIDRSVVWEKFQIKNLFEQGYERILYVDTDVFIKPNCPDVFSIVPLEKIGGVYDTKENEPGNKDRIEVTKQLLGDINWQQGYINDGVFMVSNLHKDIFDIPSKAPKGWLWNMHALNYNIYKFGFQIYRLDTKFNAMFLYGYPTNNKEIQDIDAYIVHFAACGRREERLKFLYEKYKNDFIDYN